METLLLPGMDGTGRLFAAFERCLFPRLAPRVVAYPSHEPRTYDELLDGIPVPEGPFTVVAESFSGPLGIRLAARHPDRVRALVLVATFVRSPSLLAAWARPLLHRLFGLRPPDLALRFGLLGMDSSPDQLMALRAALDSVDAAVLATRLTQIIDVDVSDAFRAVATPAMYLAGARDRLVGARPLARMRRLRPDMETVVLDAPHLVLQRRPAEAARCVAAFLDRVG